MNFGVKKKTEDRSKLFCFWTSFKYNLLLSVRFWFGAIDKFSLEPFDIFCVGFLWFRFDRTGDEDSFCDCIDWGRQIMFQFRFFCFGVTTWIRNFRTFHQIPWTTQQKHRKFHFSCESCVCEVRPNLSWFWNNFIKSLRSFSYKTQKTTKNIFKNFSLFPNGARTCLSIICLIVIFPSSSSSKTRS